MKTILRKIAMLFLPAETRAEDPNAPPVVDAPTETPTPTGGTPPASIEDQLAQARQTIAEMESGLNDRVEREVTRRMSEVLMSMEDAATADPPERFYRDPAQHRRQDIERELPLEADEGGDPIETRIASLEQMLMDQALEREAEKIQSVLGSLKQKYPEMPEDRFLLVLRTAPENTEINYEALAKVLHDEEYAKKQDFHQREAARERASAAAPPPIPHSPAGTPTSTQPPKDWDGAGETFYQRLKEAWKR